MRLMNASRDLVSAGSAAELGARRLLRHDKHLAAGDTVELRSRYTGCREWWDPRVYELSTVDGGECEKPFILWRREYLPTITSRNRTRASLGAL